MSVKSGTTGVCTSNSFIPFANLYFIFSDASILFPPSFVYGSILPYYLYLRKTKRRLSVFSAFLKCISYHRSSSFYLLSKNFMLNKRLFLFHHINYQILLIYFLPAVKHFLELESELLRIDLLSGMDSSSVAYLCHVV